MAEFHLSLKIGAKGKAAPHFHYITASEKYAAKRGVEHVEHGNMPAWSATDPALYWQASDTYERANGTAYRELEVSLPRELPLSMQLDLARQLAAEACGDSHAYSFAIHHTKASDGGKNPHVHLQFSERIQDGLERDMATFFKRANKKDPEKGGCLKSRAWQATSKGSQKRAESSNRLIEIREKWADICNAALELHGSTARIDHRSYTERGIDRTPQPKVGAQSWHLYQRTGEKNERFQRWEQVVASNDAIIISPEKLSIQENLSHAMQRQSAAQRKLVALDVVHRPDKQTILLDIAKNQKHARRLEHEIWQLENVTKHKAYDKMMQKKWQRDAGSNWLMRGLNRFWHGGDYTRLKGEYDDVLSAKETKTKQRKRLIERLCQHPFARSQASKEYAQQAKEYHAYIAHKAELESELQSAKRDVESCRRALPQPKLQRQHDNDLHLSLRM